MEEDKGKEAGSGKGDRSKHGGGKPNVPSELEGGRQGGGGGSYGRLPVPVFFVPKTGPVTPDDRLWDYIQDVSDGLSFKQVLGVPRFGAGGSTHGRLGLAPDQGSDSGQLHLPQRGG